MLYSYAFVGFVGAKFIVPVGHGDDDQCIEDDFTTWESQVNQMAMQMALLCMIFTIRVELKWLFGRRSTPHSQITLASIWN
ncbi:hypothetical protein H6P81_020278 [Aristolochia fimbriata]|uniref:Uncharacterized protein n=1 Tax=Aristolochia fimbriata TaxID=158543 RepID=A0AAV7DUZ5_ARIFI|nr:hypothetical protein H6P81_020278 [Aristolochia fimbriata]